MDNEKIENSAETCENLIATQADAALITADSSPEKTAEKTPKASAPKKPVPKTPVAKKPTAKKPATDKKPTAKKPTAEKPASEKKPTAEKPATEKKPTAEKPAVDKVTVEKPAEKKPTVEKKPVAKKPAAKKSPAKKPAKKVIPARDVEDEYGLKLFFQPVYEPSENRVYGYECLLRIVDRELGVITPDLFLGVAQKNASLMKGLEEWSLAELFRTARLFVENKKRIDMLSLNIDTNNFFRKDFYTRVSKYLGKVTENIYFELKEDAFFSSDPAVSETIGHLRRDGIKIAVDDFTANFLMFEWGEFVPFDMIKIERTYIDRFMTSPKAHLIVEKIIAFAAARNLELVAVGVENSEQEAELIRMGCARMQGYYYSKPMQIKKLMDN